MQGSERDAQVEVGEDELDGGEEERCEGDGEDGGVGGLGDDVPAEGVDPGDFYLGDFDAAGFGEAEADVVPVVLVEG